MNHYDEKTGTIWVDIQPGETLGDALNRCDPELRQFSLPEIPFPELTAILNRNKRKVMDRFRTEPRVRIVAEFEVTEEPDDSIPEGVTIRRAGQDPGAAHDHDDVLAGPDVRNG